MKKVVFVSFSLLLFVVLSSPAQAQTRFGVRIGVTDGDPMIGGELLVPLGSGFVFDPNLEVTSKLFTANADFHYDIPIDRRTSWWLGAGPAIVKPEHSSSELGINLLGGIGTTYRGMYPYAQVKFTSARNTSDFGSVAVGLRF